MLRLSLTLSAAGFVLALAAFFGRRPA